MRFGSYSRVERLAAVALALVASAGAANEARAQNLGADRQFLAIEPYYVGINVDQGAGASSRILPGVGGRLWINGAAFGIPLTGVVGFVSYTPKSQGLTTIHYGGELDVFPMNRPIGGFIDPFISVGAGAFHTKREITLRTRSGLGPVDVVTTKFALTPGGGVRLPLPNQFQIRADVSDVIVFKGKDGFVPSGEQRTTNNVQFTLGIGLTF